MASEMSCVNLMFEGHQFRVVPKNGDELWLVLVDVCQTLEHSNPSMAAKALDRDELSNAYVVDSAGRQQEMLIVSEPGFYKLTETSRKPAARRLNRWYRHEVLPSLRKYGCYPPPANIIPPEMVAITQLFDQKFNEKLEPIRSDIKEIKTSLKLVVDNSAKGRKDPTLETQRIHGKVIRYHFFGKCPCGECDMTIMDEDGFIPSVWNYHHQFNRWDNRPTATIPLAKECHERIERDAEARTRFGANAFPHFQRLLARLPPRQPRLPLGD